MASATVTTTALIDVSPDGISITFEGVDADLANLISQASGFTAQTPVYRALGVSDLVVKSNKIISFVDPTPPSP